MITSIPIINGIPTGGNGSVATIDALMVTQTVALTPSVTTANAYGINFVVGGLLTFTNAFGAQGSGILQGVRVTCKKVETQGFIFFPFNANPTNSTFNDNTIAAINALDVTKVLPPIVLNNNSQLGTHTIASAVSLGESMSVGNTTMYGLLVTNAPLTNQFGTNSDVTVEITTLQDS